MHCTKRRSIDEGRIFVCIYSFIEETRKEKPGKMRHQGITSGCFARPAKK